MRGFVTIDRQPKSAVIAIWVTARGGGGSIDQESANGEEGGPRGIDTRPINVNAVVVDVDLDPCAMDKVRSLTRSAVVIATAGSVLDGLPIDGEPIHISDFEALLDETEAQQRRILEALEIYATNISPKTGKVLKPRSIVRPEWLPRPSPEQFKPREDSAPARALATANYACAAWRYWLVSDDERRARALPSGRTPSRMSPELRSSIVPDFPPDFASILREQNAV